MRVVSGNLRSGKVDPAEFVEFVRAMDADVVAVQEAAGRHFEALSKGGFPHGEFQPGGQGTGLGIALKRPAKLGVVPIKWRDAPTATLDPAEWPELAAPMRVMTLHIAAPHVYRPPGWGFVLRWRQVRGLEEHFGVGGGAEQEAPTLVVGDFNATPIWPLYRRVSKLMTDAAIEVAQRRGRRVEPTWPTLGQMRPRLRIDHVFTRGVRVEDVIAAPIPGSDHSALVVDVGG